MSRTQRLCVATNGTLCERYIGVEIVLFRQERCLGLSKCPLLSYGTWPLLVNHEADVADCHLWSYGRTSCDFPKGMLIQQRFMKAHGTLYTQEIRKFTEHMQKRNPY